MPGPNEPGYNVLHPPKTRAFQSWWYFWRSLTYYDRQRAARARLYTNRISRVTK